MTPGQSLRSEFSMRRRCNVYDPVGVPLFEFGKHGGGRDNVSFPTAIDIDPQGRMLIMDSFAHRIRVFTSPGRI